MRSQPPRRFRSILILLMLGLGVMLLVGCGDSSAPDTSGTTAQAPDTTAAQTAETTATAATVEETTTTEGSSITRAEDLSSTIVLPAGWAMDDALTPADIEEVIGRTGYTAWPEADSSAAEGRPAGSFYDGTLIDTKIYFRVYAQDGRAEFERLTGFVENGEEVAADLWGKLIVGDAKLTDPLLVQTLVLREDVCMSIQWRPEQYGEFDRLDLGVRLADMLVAKLFKAE